jgi:serine/threonine protein kinase
LGRVSGDPHTVRQIGRYEIIRKIATGGMAELFLARFVGPGGFEKRCALKRILPQFASDQVFTRMFLNEARVTAMFDHPNLVQIFELGQDDDGQFFIAMELVNGINLRQLLHLVHERGIRIPPELAAFMVTQALDGLAYAHDFRDPDGRALNLVHRDISPQNILVSYDGWVKLVDFGIVKGNSISSETQAGMLKGKVAYMSPEQATGEHIDGRSDLFSLGVCFYELVAQERPFQAINEIMTLKAILEHQPPPITAYVPDIADGLEEAIHRALEKLPSDRYNHAREFQEHLSHVLRACPNPIGRHTLSEFIGSLTEGTTSSFDSTRVKIPRGLAGFGHSLSPEGSGPKPIKTPAPKRIGPPTDPKAAIRRPPNGPDAPTPTPMDQARTMDGMTAEVRAAGLSKAGVNPLAVSVFIASALAGAVVVFLATRPPEVVPLVVAPPPVVPPPLRSCRRPPARRRWR